MSAYLMNDTDFADLATYYWHPANGECRGRPSNNFFNSHTRQGFECDGSSLALLLATENIASVAYRYPDQPYGGFLDDDNDSGESIATFMGEIVTEYRNRTRLLSHAEAWDLCRSLHYQSCEHPGYYASNGYAVLEAIKHKAGCGMAAEAQEAA